MDVMDCMYYKWVGISRSIKKRTNDMTVDLLGGFDSRMIAAIWLISNYLLIELFKTKLFEKFSKNYNITIDSHLSEDIIDTNNKYIN